MFLICSEAFGIPHFDTQNKNKFSTKINFPILQENRKWILQTATWPRFSQQNAEIRTMNSMVGASVPITQQFIYLLEQCLRFEVSVELASLKRYVHQIRKNLSRIRIFFWRLTSQLPSLVLWLFTCRSLGQCQKLLGDVLIGFDKIGIAVYLLLQLVWR